jgi:hypothetical protein
MYAHKMTEAHANPSRDPANDDSLLGMVRQILDKFLQQVDDMLPARVVSYDRATNRASVIPMVKVLTTDGRQVTRAQIASVPVLMPGGNDALMSFDLRAGDLGWIKASDRDISLTLHSGVDSAPNTLRKHSFSDGLFIPDISRGVTIATEDAHNAVFQRRSSAVRVALWDALVKITAARGLLVSDTDGAGLTSALLEIKSTVKGACPWPRMTQAQRDAIPVTPADEGLAVWNLTTHALSTYNGTHWS